MRDSEVRLQAQVSREAAMFLSTELMEKQELRVVNKRHQFGENRLLIHLREVLLPRK